MKIKSTFIFVSFILMSVCGFAKESVNIKVKQDYETLVAKSEAFSVEDMVRPFYLVV